MHPNISQHAVELAKAIVPNALQRMRSERRFFAAHGGYQGLYLGKFSSFAEAREFASSKGASAHYFIDHQEWTETHSAIKAHDYPILYWLGRLLEKGSVLIDLGGSTGVCYYNYRSWLELPENLTWQVCELPEAVAIGREIAQEQQAAGLSFTTDARVIDGSSILFSAGTLQYIESPLASMLADLKTPPRHILINRLALCRDMPAFVTIEHTGYAFAPVRVDNFDDFVKSMNAIGYVKVDSWKCLENSLHVSLHDECRLKHYYGMYFRFQEAAGDRVTWDQWQH